MADRAEPFGSDRPLRTPRQLAGSDPDYLIEFGNEAIRYYPPYMAIHGGRWHVFEAWKVVKGPNVGATEYKYRPMRWWHPGDLWLFVRDRLDKRRQFGKAWRG